MIIINIAKDFTLAPGPRHKRQGNFSGELFREKLLKPAYIQAKNSGDKIQVILDGTFGYYDSFLEESFGGLKRDFPEDDIYSYFKIVSDEEPEWVGKIKEMIDEALSKEK